MHNFVFHNPVKVIFGKETLQQTGPECAALGTPGTHGLWTRGVSMPTGLRAGEIFSTCSRPGMIEHGKGSFQSSTLSRAPRESTRQKKKQADLVLAVGRRVRRSTRPRPICAGGHGKKHDVWKFFTWANVPSSLACNWSTCTQPGRLGVQEMNQGMG